MIWEAWKCRLVGTRKEASREPCVRTRGRKEEEDLGVETPVCGPVDTPYILRNDVRRKCKCCNGENVVSKIILAAK